MNLDALIEAIPSYAKDLKLNFSSVVRQQTDLNEQQAWGTVVASAITSRNPELITAALDEAASHLTTEALDAAKGAAAIMGMNNIFYRFLHLSSNEKYRSMRAGLRMNIMRTHGIDPLDFELWSAAVSAINGCGACVDSHEKALREKGSRRGEDYRRDTYRVRDPRNCCRARCGKRHGTSTRNRVDCLFSRDGAALNGAPLCWLRKSKALSCRGQALELWRIDPLAGHCTVLGECILQQQQPS